MRWPTFGEAFWFAVLLAAPAFGGAIGLGLRLWLNLPSWAVVACPLVGLAGLFVAVRALVWLDDRRRKDEPGSVSVPSR